MASDAKLFLEDYGCGPCGRGWAVPDCRLSRCSGALRVCSLAHQNRTIAIASDCRADGAKSPEIPQKEGLSGSKIATRNRKSLATLHRTPTSQCKLKPRKSLAISGVRESAMGIAIANRKKSLRFRCAKVCRTGWRSSEQLWIGCGGPCQALPGPLPGFEELQHCSAQQPHGQECYQYHFAP